MLWRRSCAYSCVGGSQMLHGAPNGTELLVLGRKCAPGQMLPGGSLNAAADGRHVGILDAASAAPCAIAMTCSEPLKATPRPRELATTTRTVRLSPASVTS